MSAADDYTKHIRTRYRLSVPVAEKIRWQETKVRLLEAWMEEDPSIRDWASAEVASIRSFINDLRRDPHAAG